MLNKLKNLLTDTVDNDESVLASPELAAAALLVEVMSSDYEHHPEEHRALRHLLQNEFELDATEAEALVEEAIAAHDDATDYFHFTRAINDQYDATQKEALIEAMWQMAWADEDIQAVEQHVIRRIASLIHVPHQKFIAAKLRVIGK